MKKMQTGNKEKNRKMDFSAKKEMMLARMKQMKKCIKNSESMEYLKACKMKMMQKKKEKMHKKQQSKTEMGKENTKKEETTQKSIEKKSSKCGMRKRGE